jgi:hypothetical protein
VLCVDIVGIVSVQVFEHDDAGYERWLGAHPGGFVINARRRPSPAYLKLHRASCGHIRVLQHGYSRWTTGEYIKICASDRGELIRWAQGSVGGEPEQRCYCVNY